MNDNGKGTVYRRCGCRSAATGTQLGPACPRLTDSGHGSWYYAIDIPRLHGNDRQRVRRGGYESEQAARNALAELLGAGHRPDRTTVLTTGGWLHTWITSRVGIAPLTREGYLTHIRLYLEPFLGGIRLSELRRAYVQSMLDRLAERGAGGIPLCPNTLTRIRATLRAALNAAIREGLIETNPACGVSIPTYHRIHAVIWTEDQIARWRLTGQRPPVSVWTSTQTGHFLTATRKHRLHAAFHLIALRGLRRAEAAGLRWQDVDLDHRILVISQTTQRVDGRLTPCAPKSESSRRTVVLDHSTVKQLRRHRARQAAEAAERGFDPGGYVFTNRRGQPLNPDYLYREFVKAAADAGLPPIRLHDLRHGAATLSLQAGNELKVIQDKLGHASISLTADTYTSVAPELARREAETTARLIADAAHPGSRLHGRNRRGRIPLDGVRRRTSHAWRLAGHPR